MDRGVTHDSGVWRIKGRGEEIESLKAALLQSICQQCSPFVHYDEAEDPPEQGPLGLSQIIGRGIWRVPAGTSGESLLAWLFMGNWQLYVADKPLQSVPDLIRANNEEVREFVRLSGVVLIVDSFHDDTDWTLSVSPDDA